MATQIHQPGHGNWAGCGHLVVPLTSTAQPTGWHEHAQVGSANKWLAQPLPHDQTLPASSVISTYPRGQDPRFLLWQIRGCGTSATRQGGEMQRSNNGIAHSTIPICTCYPRVPFLPAVATVIFVVVLVVLLTVVLIVVVESAELQTCEQQQ